MSLGDPGQPTAVWEELPLFSPEKPAQEGSVGYEQGSHGFPCRELRAARGMQKAERG